MLGASSAPAPPRSRASPKEGSASSSSGCWSIRVNSVMLSGYLKISELNKAVYAAAASA